MITRARKKVLSGGAIRHNQRVKSKHGVLMLWTSPLLVPLLVALIFYGRALDGDIIYSSHDGAIFPVLSKALLESPHQKIFKLTRYSGISRRGISFLLGDRRSKYSVTYDCQQKTLVELNGEDGCTQAWGNVSENTIKILAAKNGDFQELNRLGAIDLQRRN